MSAKIEIDRWTCGFIEQRGGQRGFAVLELEDALLDGVFGDQLIDEDVLLLADAMRAIGGLAFDGGIPPRIVVDDRIGGGEIEPGAAGFEADEKERHLAVLEARDRRFAIARVAAQLDEGHVALSKLRHDQIEHRGELREEQDAPPVVDQALEHLEQRVEFLRFVDARRRIEFEQDADRSRLGAA